MNTDIPVDDWATSVKAAADTTPKVLASLTIDSSGAVRLIQGCFDRLSEAQKVNAAAVLLRAKEKVEQSGRPTACNIEPRVVVSALENASLQNDPTLTELWSNLLAQEFTHGGIHPAIPSILARLTAEDANALVSVVANQGRVNIRRLARRPTQPSGGLALRSFPSKKPNLSHSVLAGLNLIGEVEDGWKVTALGEAFIKAVTDFS